jgi:hypothetical protein
MSSKPRWRDQAAVIAWAIEAYEEELSEEQRIFWTEQLPQIPDDFFRLPPPPTPEQWERIAVRDAKQGDFTALAKLVASGAPLSEGTRQLAHDRMIGTFKIKQKAGRKKVHPDHRTTVHAARMVPDLIRILRGGYPDQTRTQIRDRAVEAAAAHYKINPETVRNLLNRPRRYWFSKT